MTDKSFDSYASMSDKALTIQMGSFVKHHRMNQHKSQDELAKEAGISRSTLSLLERGESVTIPTLIQVIRVLNQLQIMNVFEVKDSPSPLELAKRQKQKRQRIRKKTNKLTAENIETDW